MTSPQDLVHLSTSARTNALRTVERNRIAQAIAVAASVREEAQTTLRGLNEALDRTRAQAGKVNANRALYPPSPEIEQERARLAKEIERLTGEQWFASALSAAAAVAHESAELERAWLDRPTTHTAAEVSLRAEILRAFSTRVVTAPGYTVKVLRLEPHNASLRWQETDHGRIRRSRARSIVKLWDKHENTHVLCDPHGRLYIAASRFRMELTPTDIAPPHTEGDALKAALAAYGFNSYDDGEGGHSWLIVPLDPHIPEDSTELGLHVRINSGDRIDRSASKHGETWSAGVHDQDGEYVTTLTSASEGTALVLDCAHIARVIADYARLVNGS
ncbi:hypothetical protein [Streptomyces sp. NPDC004267]|uniref:hypothetical protein n=1 Tax=Streptomyces sp. NPDC004267 TaxID=3364694 RepID=UPI0036CFE0E0